VKFKIDTKLGVVAHTYKPSTQEAVPGRSELKASLGCIATIYLKKTKKAWYIAQW
jgi:hypothetical protein